MSNVSASSATGNSSRARGRVYGIPKQCWCGDRVVAKISKSEVNPYRRYYRCGYAANQKLMNDEHVFEWVDEAMFNEIEKLEAEVAKIKGASFVVGHEEFEKMRLRMELEVLERVDYVLVESSKTMKKILATVVIGLLAIVAIGFFLVKKNV